MAGGGRINFDGGGSPLQKFRQEIVESMKPYAPDDVTEDQLQLVVKDITLDMTAEQAQASALSNFRKLFGMAEGGRIGLKDGYRPGAPIDPLDPQRKISEVMDAYDRYYKGPGKKVRKIPFRRFFEIYAKENFADGGTAGGMLVSPSVDGSRPGYKKAFKKKDNLPKNIRLTPEGRYRFTTEIGSLVKEGNRMGSMTFPKGTDLQDVIKFRDNYLKKAGVPIGGDKIKKVFGNYVNVEGEPHIRFVKTTDLENYPDGKKYRVGVQRYIDKKRVVITPEDQSIFSSLDEAKKARDTLVENNPAKTLTEYNLQEKPKKINADILKLHKDPLIKQMFRDGVVNQEAIERAAQILKVNNATAAERIGYLASTYAGDRIDVPGIKKQNVDNALKIAGSIPGAKTKAAELAVGKPFIGETIKNPKIDIVGAKAYPTDIFDIDEAKGTVTSLKRGSTPYSIFGQIIDQNVNRNLKGGFRGAASKGWDNLSSDLELNVQRAIATGDQKQINIAKNLYNRQAKLFEDKVNSKRVRGAKKIVIPKISLEAPKKTIARYGEFNKKYQNIFDKNFAKQKYSFVIPKDLRTIPELRKDILDPNSSTYKKMINTLKKGFNEFDEKKLFDTIKNKTPRELQKILRMFPRIASVDDFETNRFASADNIMTSGVEYVDDVDKSFAEKNPLTTGAGLSAAGTAGVLKATGTPVKSAIGKVVRGAGTRAGVLPFVASQIKSNIDQGENPVDAVVDPLVGLELSFPGLFKENLAKITKNPTAQRILNLGKIGRLTTPVGLGITAAGLGIDAAKFTRDRIKELKAMSPEERAELRQKGEAFAFDPFQAAGGGIAKLAGDPSGAMLESMNPDSQGLRSLKKRVKTI
jgi:hypothetical protein